MTTLTVSCIIFACIFAGAVAGMVLRALLPESHLGSETKDLIKLGMGLIGTMTALVLGLLVASAKSTFDAQRNGLAQLSGNIIFMDRLLAHYGPEAKGVRETLRDSVADMLDRIWPGESPNAGKALESSQTEGRYEGFYEQIQQLNPKTETQRAIQGQVLKLATDIAQSRWLLFTQKGSSIPMPFLVVMVSWLALIMASFSLFAPPNATVFITMLICALVVSSSVFLILELDHPFSGLLQVSSTPLRLALGQLGRS